MISITVCGSSKLKSLIHETCAKLEEAGFVVLTPPLHDIETLTNQSSEECKLLSWKGATFAHFKRIEVADICLIVNPDGYIGNSTTLELGYAVASKKLIISFMPDSQEMARQGLIDFVLNTKNPDGAVALIKKKFK